MKKKSAYAQFMSLTPADRAAETARFDGDFDDRDFRPLDDESAAVWRRVKRKRGRPVVGQGSMTISVSVEKGLLSEADELASRLGVSRAKLIANGLRRVLQSAKTSPRRTAGKRDAPSKRPVASKRAAARKRS